MALILAFGISFELPVLLVLLCRVGLVHSSQLAEKRRYAIVALVTFAAIVTPPDVFSQLALAIPLYALYELSIVIARMIEKDRRETEDEDEEPAASTQAGAAAGAGTATAAPARTAATTPQIVDENDFNLAR
jgi:sec-independent protein translocase protein TatC